MKESKKACNHAFLTLPSSERSSAFCDAYILVSTKKKLRLAVAALMVCGIGLAGMEKVDAYVAGNGSIEDLPYVYYYPQGVIDYGVAIGSGNTDEYTAKVIGFGGVSIGYNTSAYSQCVAIGQGAKAGKFVKNSNPNGYTSGFEAVAIGSGATAMTTGAIALGSAAYNYGYRSISIGNQAAVYANYSVVIGDGARIDSVFGSNSVVLGSNSTADTSNVVSVGRAEQINEAGEVTTEGIYRRIINVRAGILDSDATTFAQIKTDENGSYIKKSLTNSTTLSTALNTEGTVGKNLTALDNAIGVVTVPTTVSSSGRSLLTASTGKLYVLGESLNEDGSLKTSVSDNLIKLDQKIGEITSNYGILSNDNTISQNLMALEAAIAKANQTLDFSNPNGTAPTNGTTNGVTNGVTNGDPQGTTNSDTTKSSTTIYSNDGKPIATLTQGSVTKGDTGFVSGGQVWNADMAAGQSISLSDATHTVNGKNIGANQIASNDGTVLATFQKMKEVSSSDNGFVSGSDLYNEVRPEDGKYVKNNSTTGDNLNALDDAVAALDKKTEGLISTDDGTGTGSGTGSGDGTSTGGGTIHIGGGSSATNVTVINIAKDDGTARTFTGVADGVNDYDAVNMRQYNALSSNMRDVAAGAAALAALHPGTYDPTDKMSFAVGFGHYKDANAGALGAFYRPNADTTVSLGSTIGNGDPMMNVGVSFKLGARSKGAGIYSSNTELVREVNSLRKDNERYVKVINAQAERIESLEAQVAQILKKLELSGTVKKTVTK